MQNFGLQKQTTSQAKNFSRTQSIKSHAHRRGKFESEEASGPHGRDAKNLPIISSAYSTQAGTGMGGEARSTSNPDSDKPESIYRYLLQQFAITDRQHTSIPANEQQAHKFLQHQLELADSISADIPDVPQQLDDWAEENVKNIGNQYHSYIAERKAGAPRRMFTTRSHALYFLRAVAPTKLVDGAWLYGLLSNAKDSYIAPFIAIYLDELGHGKYDQNHVSLYNRLLMHEDVNTRLPLSERHYVQGAIQLSLARYVQEFLPEIIGFNLGYEQLPLHLLVTAYELAELGIDPYYFTLHVTIDNFDSGHAHKALEGALALLPKIDDGGDFYRRMVRGYKMNFLGIDTPSVIAEFNADNELNLMLQHKSELGKFMHSDLARIEGRTINQWLAEPSRIGDFVQALIRAGWIRRHQNPNQSRFWRMISASNGVMAGVFNRAEQRLIYDWICGNWCETQATEIPNVGRFSRRKVARNEKECVADLNSDITRLQQQVSQCTSDQAAMDLLIPYLSPALHHSPVGLAATRIYSEYFNR
jgi:hypothetical protein